MKHGVRIGFLLSLLFATGCLRQQKVRVTYRSNPPGGTLYKFDGELLGQCPKALYYDVCEDDIERGYLDTNGMMVRWPSGPDKKSDELIRVTLDGTNRQVTFVQPDEFEAEHAAGMREKKEKARQSRTESIAKIRQYVPGHLTEDQFFSQDWNNVDPYHELIGVLTFSTGNDRGLRLLIVNMGYYVGYDVGYDPSGYSELDRETLAVWEFLMKERRKGSTSARGSVSGRLGRKAQKKVCTLLFINGQLNSVLWEPDYAVQDSESVQAVKAKNVKAVQDSELVRAARDGNLQAAQDLLSRGADVNAKTIDKRSALCFASFGGHTEVVKLLLESGADVNVKDGDNGYTALYLASMMGYTEVVKLLLESGVDVNMKTIDKGLTALHMAAGKGDTEVVRLLLENGANVTIKDTESDKTALEMASDEGHTAIVKLLLENGADAKKP